MEDFKLMKFLVNNKEYSEFLARRLLARKLLKTKSIEEPAWKKTTKVLKDLRAMLRPSVIKNLKLAPASGLDQQKILMYIQEFVTADLDKWQSQSTGIGDIKGLKNYINQKFSNLTPQQQKTIHRLFVNSTQKTLTKQLMTPYSSRSRLVPRDSIVSTDPATLFIRNTVNNEELLKTRMEQELPFMFMDSGYTNFLESNKKWHRLCVDHIHSNNFAKKTRGSRLKIFPCLPQPWRTNGNDILIIEPSAIQCRLFNIDIEQWRHTIRSEIDAKLNSPRPIVFREKVDKKIRQSLYQYLLDADVYCVVNYNSNAAIEAIWAGIPVITLGYHISNPVTANSIDQINNLPRPDLGRWLKNLSYSQYTIEEIANGTARKIMKDIYNV